MITCAVEELTIADLSNRKTHEAGHNQRRIEDILSEFRKARLRLVDRFGDFEADAVRPIDPASAAQKAIATGRPFVLRGRTRRSPFGADLGALLKMKDARKIPAVIFL